MLPSRKAGLARSLRSSSGADGATLGAHEQDGAGDADQEAGDQDRRGRSQRMHLVQHRDEARQRRRDQDRAAPVEALVFGQGCPVWGRTNQPRIAPAMPSGTLIQKAHCQPKRVEDEAADRRSGAEADRLRRRLQAEAAAAFLGPHDHHDDGDAVRGDQRAADRLQDAEEDQPRQARSHSRTARSRR